MPGMTSGMTNIKGPTRGDEFLPLPAPAAAPAPREPGIGRNLPSSYWAPVIKTLTEAGFRVVVPDRDRHCGPCSTGT
jgi:hypothetical protein